MIPQTDEPRARRLHGKRALQEGAWSDRLVRNIRVLQELVDDLQHSLQELHYALETLGARAMTLELRFHNAAAQIATDVT